MKKLLFITKNYPPAVGGMENYCRDLVKYFRKSGVEVTLLANGKGKLGLPLFALKVGLLGRWYSLRSDAIWIGDGSISMYGRWFSTLTGTPRYVTIHGLDITRKQPLYQKIIPTIVAQANHIVAVSSNTKHECVSRGIPEEKIIVIPNGIDPDRMPEVTIHKNELLKKFTIPQSKKILFSIGRHIERKGFHRFMEQVLPKLSDEYVYVLAGSGSWTEKYRQIVSNKSLNNVYLIGRISDEDKYALYQHSDLFIMPNISVPGDIEGFGIVCIEAGWYGLPVIANDIDGISDAVIDSETGVLVDGYNTKKFIDVIKKYTAIKDIKLYTKKTFSYNSIMLKYLNIINNKGE